MPFTAPRRNPRHRSIVELTSVWLGRIPVF